jgi:DNA-binding GntR family transcriptional regulator
VIYEAIGGGRIMPDIFDRETVQRVTGLNRKSDFVYEAIRKAIVSRRIKRGEWLREGMLSEELGVSRTMIRDALIRLTAEGLSVEVPYKGVKAASVSPVEIEEVYQIRARLESWAFEIAATIITPEELARMRELIPDSVAHAQLRDFEKTRAANREFHWIAIRTTKKRHLLRLLEQIWEFMPTYVFFTELSEEERIELAESEMRFHTQILEALEAGDGKLAGELTRQHILDTGTVKHAYRYVADETTEA